ncbi:hypothetical protein N657DRAFT_669105 [Parathielavia appendiculata]|uniref:Uncharacterized protein n=1 Tax=Parathielavia appendiculata TaxID=2587402 RepID=A0AAN6Z6Q7_9PEZI|nr:hypothetical protein N657DRAFT_669105 [Parathielavia appendiculata]
MAAMEAANADYRNGHQQQLGPLPASPTLTNPDMILPDYERSDSPDPDLDRADMMWKNAHMSASSSNMHHMFVATGLAGPGPYGAAGPITPTTPIIYGNGTMLSDIGEVTEVESTIGGPTAARTKAAIRRPASPKRGSGSEAALRSSPTMGAAGMMKKKSMQSLKTKREHRSSIESNSTITTDHAAVFADFDDSVSVGDSVFQGDDEESMASSYVEGTAAVEPARLGVAKVENIDRLSTYSTSSLSRRAEEILANAKRRLTTMEGNLTRARSSLHYTSSHESDGSTPSPPFQRASTAMYSRDGDPSSPSPDAVHTRMSSEIAMRNGLPYRVSMPRSQSALGAAGGYRQPLTASKSADYSQGNPDDRTVHKANSARETGPKQLTEDEVARLGEADSASQNARIQAFLSPTFGSFHSDTSVRNPQRSSSAAQMRDIKDQMRDLKGKISSLREQARVDSMKRRSLQSLRTPSPFTHSQLDQWYTEPPSNRASQISAGSLPGRNPWNGEVSSVDGDAKEFAHHRDDHAEGEDTEYADAETGVDTEHVAEPKPSPSTPVAETNHVNNDVSDLDTENDEMNEEQEGHQNVDDADRMSESGESLYHDTVQYQISHEDREDAFDYEHFFLHSAMGTMSLTRRSSTESFSSEDSVETTRGPISNGANSGEHSTEQPSVLGRRNSSNSISTIDTFATAQEGRSLKSPVSPDEYHSIHDSSSRATSAQSHRHRSGSTATAKRLSLNPPSAYPTPSNTATRDSDGSISPIAEESSVSGSPANHTVSKSSHSTTRRSSVIHRPMSSALHRPSIASFDSVGTNRSFPLVNKPYPRKAHSTTGVLTPRDSPDHAQERDTRRDSELNTIASMLMSDMAAAHDARSGSEPEGDAATNGDGAGNRIGGLNGAAHPLEALLREDRYLVERVVASLGRCVLGLTENGRASAESRMYRRRIDAARRALEGIEGDLEG